jgi:hypothetical protein
MALRDFTAFERRRRGGKKGVASHRNRRRPGMRCLADEPHHVPLQTKGTEHDSRRPIHRFEHRSLLDVHLEVCLRVDAREFLPCVEHGVERHAVIAQRVLEPDAVGVAQLSHLVDVEAAGGRR